MPNNDLSDIFYQTDSNAADFDSYERFRLDASIPEAPVVIGERIIPDATSSGASFIRNTRIWEVEHFTSSDAPPGAKEAFERLQEARNAARS
jgi:hypothetical protein